jgi:hypothetical protein
MNPNLTKAQRRRIRELGGMAYERELSEHLTALESEFKRWRASEIDGFALSEAIHRFHQGPARDLFSKYESSYLDFAVANAIHRGVLSEDEVGADVLEGLARHLVHLREHDDK